MRSSFAQVLHGTHSGSRRENLADWWLEWPCRNSAFWRVLLLDKGQGWLRWGTDDRVIDGGYMEPPEPFLAAPPARRLCWWLRCKVAAPYRMIRFHLSYEEVTCDWSDLSMYVDLDRYQELWGYSRSYKPKVRR